MKKKKTTLNSKKVELLYLGERVDMLGNIRQKFRDSSGQHCYFTGLRSIFFNESYCAEKQNKELMIAKKPSLWPKRKLLATPEEQIEFEVTKLACIQARNERKKAMHLKQPHADIKKAIRLLRPFVKSVDFITANRFMDYVRTEVSKRGK